MVIDKTEINAQLLADMRATAGWKLFEEMLKSKYDSDVVFLITGSDDAVMTASKKARCKLVKEILAESGMNKEERWTI